MRTQKRTDAVSTSSRMPLLVPALLLVIAAASSHAASDSAGSSTDSRITVTDVAGDVAVTMVGDAEAVSVQSVLRLPARIVTGHDGTLGLTQAGTRISVSNDTDVEIPAEAVDGNLVARLVQHSGNVFYDVAPRDVGKLRVETPFLVAVIKGTQFNVSVQEDGTTISLFEGHLEIRTPDDSDVVELDAGEIAIRSLIDDSIRVVGMDDLRVAVPPPPAAPAALDDSVAASMAAPEDGVPAADEAVAAAGSDVSAAVDAKDESLVVVRQPRESAAVDTALLTGVEITAGLPQVSAAETAALAVDLTVDLPIGNKHLGMDLGREAPPGLGGDRGRSVELPVDVALDTSLDLGAPSVDVDLDVDADLGDAANLGADAGIDLGAALDVVPDVGPDLGAVVDTGVDVSVDDGPIALTVDAGSGGFDLDIDVAVAGPVDLALDVRRDAPVRKPRGVLGALP
jgi:hypothetical protein